MTSRRSLTFLTDLIDVFLKCGGRRCQTFFLAQSGQITHHTTQLSWDQRYTFKENVDLLQHLSVSQLKKGQILTELRMVLLNIQTPIGTTENADFCKGTTSICNGYFLLWLSLIVLQPLLSHTAGVISDPDMSFVGLTFQVIYYH